MTVLLLTVPCMLLFPIKTVVIMSQIPTDVLLKLFLCLHIRSRR